MVFQDFCPWQQLAVQGRGNRYHLHSTARTFCGGDDDDGLIPVSEDAEDMEAPVWDTANTKNSFDFTEMVDHCKIIKTWTALSLTAHLNMQLDGNTRTCLPFFEADLVAPAQWADIQFQLMPNGCLHFYIAYDDKRERGPKPRSRLQLQWEAFLRGEEASRGISPQALPTPQGANANVKAVLSLKGTD